MLDFNLLQPFWLPILLSAVSVFVISSLIHMVLHIHDNDFKQVPNEEGVRKAVKALNIPPGNYFVPFCGKEYNGKMDHPEYLKKYKEGMGMFTGKNSMGMQFIHWFLYCIVVGVFTALIVQDVKGSMDQFWAVSVVSWMGYTLALIQQSIWWKRKWIVTLKYIFDGILMGTATAGCFVYFWPL